MVCFHVQQAVEKALKAVLFSRQIEFERIHDLIKLGRLLAECNIVLPAPEDQLRRLNAFAVTFRYDDLDVEHISLAEMGRLVMQVRRWAEEQVRAATEPVSD
jgi:HEPN domain-containing protein